MDTLVLLFFIKKQTTGDMFVIEPTDSTLTHSPNHRDGRRLRDEVCIDSVYFVVVVCSCCCLLLLFVLLLLLLLLWIQLFCSSLSNCFVCLCVCFTLLFLFSSLFFVFFSSSRATSWLVTFMPTMCSQNMQTQGHIKRCDVCFKIMVFEKHMDY